MLTFVCNAAILGSDVSESVSSLSADVSEYISEDGEVLLGLLPALCGTELTSS